MGVVDKSGCGRKNFPARFARILSSTLLCKFLVTPPFATITFNDVRENDNLCACMRQAVFQTLISSFIELSVRKTAKLRIGPNNYLHNRAMHAYNESRHSFEQIR